MPLWAATAMRTSAAASAAPEPSPRLQAEIEQRVEGEAPPATADAPGSADRCATWAWSRPSARSPATTAGRSSAGEAHRAARAPARARAWTTAPAIAASSRPPRLLSAASGSCRASRCRASAASHHGGLACESVCTPRRCRGPTHDAPSAAAERRRGASRELRAVVLPMPISPRQSRSVSPSTAAIPASKAWQRSPSRRSAGADRHVFGWPLARVEGHHGQRSTQHVAELIDGRPRRPRSWPPSAPSPPRDRRRAPRAAHAVIAGEDEHLDALWARGGWRPCHAAAQWASASSLARAPAGFVRCASCARAFSAAASSGPGMAATRARKCASTSRVGGHPVMSPPVPRCNRQHRQHDGPVTMGNRVFMPLI